MAVTCVWVYLFGQNNAVYYSPFSLVLGSPYYTGDCYVTEGRLEILLYSCVPAELLVMLITIAVIVIAVTAAVYIGSIKRCRPGKKAVISAVAASLILLLSGCSQSTADNTAADGRYGFAYDGDADRCLCIDDKGNIVDGDLILYVCGVYMKQNGELDNNTVVTTIMSNIGLYKAFDAVGIDYAKTDVGDKYVYECMRNNNFRLGGEQSGHIIFSKYATTGDGILTSIKLMEVMLSTKKKMSELISPVVIYPQCLKNIRVESKPEARADVDVQAEVEKVAKLLGDDGRILVRESGTEPVIRVMVEAKTDHLAEKYVNQVIKVIEDKGHAV